MARTFKKSAVSFTGFFYSVKNQDSVWFSSLAALYKYYYLENDPLVINYKSEYPKITNRLYKGSLHSYTPDIFAFHKVRNKIIECKIVKFINNEHTLQQVAIGTQFAYEEDCDFELAIKEDLMAGYRLFNYKLFYRYARLGIPHNLLSSCLGFVRDHPEGVELNKVAKVLSGTDSLAFSPIIFAMLFQQLLVTDLDLPVNGISLIRASI